jgi:hypothetical protein
VNVTVKSRGCLKIGIEVLIIDYICYFLIWPPLLQLFLINKFSSLFKGAYSLFKVAN